MAAGASHPGRVRRNPMEGPPTPPAGETPWLRRPSATLSTVGGPPPHIIDLAGPARGPLERRAVVEYVLNTPELQETDYLEWKSGYDLSTRPGAAATAKQLIGFANRDESQAARHMGGHGYLLLGVEPEHLVGVPEWDSADIENWLAPYVGPELRYDVHVVGSRGKKVLLFDVDRPQPGDPIFCLKRAGGDPDGKALPEGAIYVRRSGKTDIHNAADLTRLQMRARAAGTHLNLQVELDATDVAVIDSGLLEDELRDSYLRERRDALLQSLPASGPFGMPLYPPHGEFRSVDRFQAEVDRFVESAAQRWGSFVAAEHVTNQASKLTAELVNDTDDNFHEVVVELEFPLPRIYIHLSPYDARELFNAPEEPVPWGHGMSGLTQTFIPESGRGSPEIESRDDVTSLIRYQPIHARPHTRHRVGSA